MKTALVTLILIATVAGSDVVHSRNIETFFTPCDTLSDSGWDAHKAKYCRTFTNGIADALQYLIAEQGMQPLLCLPNEYPGQFSLLIDGISEKLRQASNDDPGASAQSVVTASLIDQYWCATQQKPKQPEYRYTAITLVRLCSAGLESKSKDQQILCAGYLGALHHSLQGVSGTFDAKNFYCPKKKMTFKAILSMIIDYLIEHPEQQQLPAVTVMTKAMVEKSSCK